MFQFGVGLLIGVYCHYATFPAESVKSVSPADPYAVRSPLGLSMVGPVFPSKSLRTTAVSHSVALCPEVPQTLQVKVPPVIIQTPLSVMLLPDIHLKI